MPAAAFVKFQPFIATVFNKKHDFSADNIKFYLTNATPAAGDSVKANIAEIAAGNGYTAGGYAMTVNTSSQTAGIYTAAVTVDQTITATPGALPAFRYAVAYNDSATNDELIGYWDYGDTVNVGIGEAFRFVLAGNLITCSLIHSF